LNTLYAIFLLTAVWVILCENFSLFSVITGVIISAGCLLFCRKLLPFPKIKSINLFRLAIYFLYLITQMYLAGILIIKIILTGADTDVIKVKTQIKSGFLRTLLANSITLIPGTVSLDAQDGAITVLHFKEKADQSRNPEKIGQEIKGGLEKMLLKMQK